jgi:hypothetical protein
MDSGAGVSSEHLGALPVVSQTVSSYGMMPQSPGNLAPQPSYPNNMDLGAQTLQYQLMQQYPHTSMWHAPSSLPMPPNIFGPLPMALPSNPSSNYRGYGQGVPSGFDAAMGFMPQTSSMDMSPQTGSAPFQDFQSFLDPSQQRRPQ